MGKGPNHDLDPQDRRPHRKRFRPRGQGRRALTPRLTIAFLTSWPLDPARGSGTAVAIRGLASGLELLGHRVRILGPPGTRGRRTSGLTRLRFNLSLLPRLARERFHLVVGFDLDGFAVAGRLELPYALCLKGIAADELRFEAGLNRWKLAALARLERIHTRRSAIVVVPSAYSRGILLGTYGADPERIRVVPEGIDLSTWGGSPRERRPWSGDSPTVLTVARQYRRKNTATLIRAFRHLLDSRPDARLRVVGGGPELPRLQSLARQLGLTRSVEFLGELPDREALRQEYRRADLFCLPTLQEGFGIVFLEAMAAGLPVVASDVAAVPEVVPHGRAGFLVDPRDVDRLATALLRLLQDSDLRARFGRAGRVHVRRFAWPRVARAFLEAIGGRPAVAS